MAGPIAVLTVRRMRESADSIVRKAVAAAAFLASRAVLIDVRGNDGGTRDVLETIVPLLISRPLVYNVAIVRVRRPRARRPGRPLPAGGRQNRPSRSVRGVYAVMGLSGR
jgi:C-terminal processing protease CtpA/Prc